MHNLNAKITEIWLRNLLHSFEVHSNESAYKKSGRLGTEQVIAMFHFMYCSISKGQGKLI